MCEREIERECVCVRERERVTDKANRQPQRNTNRTKANQISFICFLCVNISVIKI